MKICRITRYNFKNKFNKYTVILGNHFIRCDSRYVKERNLVLLFCLSPLFLSANDFNEREKERQQEEEKEAPRRYSCDRIRDPALFQAARYSNLLLEFYRQLLKATSPVDARPGALNHRGINLVKREAQYLDAGTARFTTKMVADSNDANAIDRPFGYNPIDRRLPPLLFRP